MAPTLFAWTARLDRAGRLLENIALVGLLSTMMVLGVGQILLREVFDSSITWADEFSRITVLWLAMIAAIAACRENRHIRIDALSHLLPDQAIRVTRVVVDLFAAVVCGVLAWHAYRYLVHIDIEYEEKVLGDFPAWIAHSVVPVAFAMTSYRFVVGAVKRALGLDLDTEEGRVL